MTDKELAEKVAERLGMKWTRNPDPTDPTWCGGYENDMPYFFCNEDYIFDPIGNGWNVFGLMIENAEKRGWEPVIYGCSTVTFCQVDSPYQVTQEYDYKKLGHIKATAYAFLETFQDET